MLNEFWNGGAEDTNQRAEFRYDYNDVEPSFSQYVDGRLAHTKTRVFAIVTGWLETRSKFEMVIGGDGKVRPNGLGHLNSFTAQIVYERISDQEVS